MFYPSSLAVVVSDGILAQQGISRVHKDCVNFSFFFERCESPLLEGVDTKGAGHSLSALKALTHHGPEVGDTQVSNF